MVLGAFASFAGVIKARLSETNVDNFVFRLHYRWTAAFCFIACALVVSSDLVGSRIQCIADLSIVTTYCWVSSTYTINSTAQVTFYGNRPTNFHGIGTFIEGIHEKKFHSYYQWVPFVLFLQGCLFCFPHVLWVSKEEKLVETLLQGLHLSPYDKEWKEKTKNIAKYLKATTKLHDEYFYWYIFCEVLNMVNILAQLFLMDLFFGGMFLHLGTKVFSLLSEDDEARSDPLIETFPRVAKCDYSVFGPSGTREKRDAMCVLPQNLLNEKIFIIMWLWFQVLICVTGLHLLMRFLMSILPTIRVKLIERRGKLESTQELNSLIRQMSSGDFFLLNSLSKNLDSLYLKGVLDIMIYDNQTAVTKVVSSAPHAHILESYQPFNEGIDEELMELKERYQSPKLIA